MADLNEQIRQRNELRTREYYRQDRQYEEGRRLDLTARIETNKAALAGLERQIATVMGRLARVEEVLNLREMFSVEAVPCGIDRVGSDSCAGCCMCKRGT